MAIVGSLDNGVRHHAEKLWQYLQHNFLSDRLFPTYEDILDAGQNTWNTLLAESGRIASLTSVQHLLGQDMWY